MGVMHEADDAYSIWSTWLCYWLDQFLTLALNTLILSIFYISLDLSTIYFAHFSGCWASIVCSCHSILECCHVFWSQDECKIVCFIYCYLSKYISRDVLDQIYKLYVRLHLDYSDIIYHKYDPEYTLELTKKLESTQYSVALAVSGSWRGTNTNRLLE